MRLQFGQNMISSPVPHAVGEERRQNHLAAGAHPCPQRHDAQALLGADDALELEQQLGVESRRDLGLFVDELLESRLAVGYLGLDALLLVRHLQVLLLDQRLLLFQGGRHLVEVLLLTLQLAPDFHLTLAGVAYFLVQRLVLTLRANRVHLAFVSAPAHAPLRWHVRADRGCEP